MTNADSIRAMSDEEIANIIICPVDADLAEFECNRDNSHNCYECCLKWLKEETK